MFGKFQFARLSTLFQNVTKDGTQASRVLALAGTSIEDLASMSERELGMTADSPMVKFKASVEQLKASLIPVGETFLQAVTPIIDFVGNILSKFNNLSSGTKKFITLLTIGLGAVGPVLLMTFGLLANGVGNIIKLFLTLRNGYLRLTGQTELLGQETNYMTMEQLDAAAAAHSLDQAHAKLTQQFTSEAAAVEALTRAYASATGAAQRFAAANPGMILPGRMPKKFAEGGIISGPGGPTSDSVPIMASNGEAIIAAKTVKKYPGMVNGLIAGNIPGFATSGVIGAAVDTSRKQVKLPGSYEMSHFGGGHQMSGQELIAYTQQASQSVRDQIQRLVSDVTNGLEYMFTVYDNKVVAMSDQLNQAVGESGSGKRAPISLAKRDLIDRGDARDIELSRLLDKAGVPIEEIKLITQNVTTQIEEGFTKLGDISTVTAEDLDRLLQDAYEAVSESDARVKAAYSQMGEVRSVADPLARGGKQNRIAIKEQSYKTQRPKYNQVMNTMTDNNPPYQLKGAMVLTDQMSQELQMTKEEIARIFKQLSAQVQVELAGLKDDAVAFATVFKDAALKIEAQATETGRSAITGLAKGTRSSSPSEEAIRQGDNVTEGFELGLRNGIPEVAAAATQVGQTAISKLINPSTGMPFATDAFSPGGIAAGAGVPLQQIVDNSRKSREDLAKSETIKKQVKLNESMDKLNKRVMGGMFAMTALSGIAQTAGGNLGKLSEIAFQISGPLFAFSSILQMLTGTKIVEFITKFKVGFGIASLALAAGVITIKAVNAARRREYMAINGLADAMKTTTDQVKTLGDFFGVVPTKLPFDVGQRELVAPTTRTQREKLKDNPEFQAQFKDTIESLRKATNDEAKLVFSGLALNLKAQGFANEQVQTIIDALREESSQTDVVLDVKSLTLSKKSLDEIKKDLIPALVKLNSALKTGATEMSAMQWGTDNVVTWTELTKEAKKELATVSTFMSEAAKSASGMFELGLIDGKQYEGMLMTLLQTTDGLDKAQRKLLLSKVFEQLGVSADKYTKSLYTARQEMQLLALLSSGVLSKDSPILKALASTDYKTNMRGVAGLKKLYDQMFGSLTKIKDKQDEIDKNNNDTSDGDGYDFFKDIKQKTLELKNQSVVLVKLRAAGIAYADAMEIASNPDMAAAIIELSKTEDGWKKAKAAIKAYNDEKKKAEKLQIATQDQGDYELTRLKMAQAYVALQEHLIDMQHIPTFKKYNDELLKQQIALEGINAEIKEITDTEIVPLQDQMRLNDYELQQIALAEDEINSKYDEQAKALEKIKTINEDIAAAQKNRLSLADALSRGDISAAAGIVQDERARQASQGMNTMSTALTNSRDQQINALGRNDLEKQNKLIQMEIARIQKEKLWDLEKEATKIQNVIDGINAEKTALERVIEKQKESIMYFGMTKAQIDAAVSALDLAKSAGIDINDPNFLNNILKGAKGDADALKLAIDAVAEAARIAFAELDALRKSSQLGASSLVPGKNDGVPDPLDTPIVPGASADAVKEAEDAAKAAADAAAAAAESNAATQELIDALAAIDAANKAADEISASTRKIAATAIVKATNTQSLNKAVALAEGNLSPESIAINMGRALTKSESMTKSLGGIGGALSTARYTGQAMRYAEMGNYAPGLYSGGIVPKSFSVGGFAMGSDIVPARLTPGEFVMSKYAVETHGVDKMKAINNGDSVGDSVYNYNLSVNVKSDANPDEIAKSVMAHIKQVDSQRIRSSRF